MASPLRRLRLRPRHVLGIALALTFALANIGAVVAKPGGNCMATAAGTYLQSGVVPLIDQNGNEIGPSTTMMGRVITLATGGSVSVVSRDNADLTNTGVTETQSDGQGTWACNGGSVTFRVLDLYRWDDATTTHSFQVDRVDFTATFTTPAAGPTLTGSLEYCSWELPANPALVRTTTSAQCAASENGVAFHLVRPFTAVRITP
jgi:hypothetical protein